MDITQHISSRIIIRTFHLVCITTVLVLAYYQFQVYMENKDQSAVGYKKFNDEKPDLYPAISICMHSLHGAIFESDEPSIQNVGGVKSYRETLVGHDNITEEFQNVVYSDVTKNLFDDFVEIFFTMTKQGDVVDTWDPSMKEVYNSSEYKKKHPFFKSYQDPNFLCMTKRVKYVPNQILNFASLVFNATSLYNSNVENLLVYMHHAGQLTRQFGKQILQLTRSNFKKAMNSSSNYYTIHINQVEILRKRHDAIIPCNRTLTNDDAMWRNKIIEKMGCIPDYWSELYFDSEEESHAKANYEKCSSADNYGLLYTDFLPPKHTDNGTNLYTGPCNQMGITASVTQSDLKEENLVLGFSYVVEEYRETYNRRAFSFKSLWSAIGGFIGMFLGCGLLQVPELAEKVVKYLKKVKEKKDIGSAATGSILNTVTAMSTFSNGNSNRQRQNSNDKNKSNNTHRIRPDKCSICSSDGKLGNQNKEVNFEKSIIESKYNPSESSFKSIIPPPPPPPQISNASYVNTISKQGDMREPPNEVLGKSDLRGTIIEDREAIIGRYDVILQKYNENVKLTEELLRRIVVLEEKSERCAASRIITKENDWL